MSAPALMTSLALAYAGMLGLCLGMDRHWKQLGSARLSPRWQRLCRPLGALLLVLAGYAASFVWPGGMALVAWFGLISLAGLALLLLLPYAPRLVLGLPLAGGLLAGLFALF
ncbi:DUF3325 domain-containing protein [Stutzerimonas azotifigens]|uniref:DUF3325 domain-containing protein n=1 Tax=Stutzerimonas azotifigens TaxID=291995 RepID=UPI0004268001|nr:DUF3325 domain-containing protein [Stutzerimonas azotifigens]